jgi:exosortase
LGLVVLAAALFWAMAPVLGEMVDRWGSDPRYSHGYLVPLFALYLAWRRWPTWSERLEAARPSSGWGLGFIAGGAGIQALGGYTGSLWLAGVALLPYLMGLLALWRGRPAVGWALPSILFLVFMVPLPYRLEVALGPPLQALATRLSTFALQVLGLMAFSEGNIIRLGEHRIGVVEACSGLSMAMTFVALATATALLVRRPLLDRLILVVSAVPIALAANVLRIVLTGVLYQVADSSLAEHFYHDLAGWLMIPLALVMLGGVAALVARMLIEYEEPGRVVVGLDPVALAPGTARVQGRTR